MEIDIASYPGDKKKPVVILIHGLGMDRKIWEEPFSARILGGSLPLSILLKRPPLPKDCGYSEEKPFPLPPGFITGQRPRLLRTIFHDLKSKGYPVITWTQKRPVGPLEAAVDELSGIVPFAKRLSENGIVLLGHSRGGLIARKYLMRGDSSIKGLITISTPHRGSSIARFSGYISPLVHALSPFFLKKTSSKSKLKTTVKRVIDFLSSAGVMELLPGSDLFQSLHDHEPEGVFCMTIGGTNPSLFGLYRLEWKTVAEGTRRRWIISPEKIFAVPDILEKIMPVTMIPEEFRKGLGDGLVTAESSRISWCCNQQDFPCSHAQILLDRKARKTILAAISGISRLQKKRAGVVLPFDQI